MGVELTAGPGRLPDLDEQPPQGRRVLGCDVRGHVLDEPGDFDPPPDVVEQLRLEFAREAEVAVKRRRAGRSVGRYCAGEDDVAGGDAGDGTLEPDTIVRLPLEAADERYLRLARDDRFLRGRRDCRKNQDQTGREHHEFCGHASSNFCGRTNPPADATCTPAFAWEFRPLAARRSGKEQTSVFRAED